MREVLDLRTRHFRARSRAGAGRCLEVLGFPRSGGVARSGSSTPLSGTRRPRGAREESPRPIPNEGRGRDEHPVRRRRPGCLLPNPSPSRNPQTNKSILIPSPSRNPQTNKSILLPSPRQSPDPQLSPATRASRRARSVIHRPSRRRHRAPDPPLHTRGSGARRGARPPGRSPVRRAMVRQVPRAEADALSHARPETMARSIRRLRVRAVLPRMRRGGISPHVESGRASIPGTNGPADVGGDGGDESSRDERRRGRGRGRGRGWETRGRGRGRETRETRGRETRRFTRAGKESTTHAAVRLGETRRRAPRHGS